jgi:glycosyltransferase involved in cell wall biosynthesis
MCHILQVGVRLDPASGGTFQSAVNWREALQRLGHQTLFANVSVSATSTSEVVVSRPTRLPMSGSFGWCRGDEVRKLYKAVERADVVIIHGLYFHASGVVAEIASKRRIPLITVLHGGLDPFVFSYRALRKRAWLRIHREALFGKSYVICATNGERIKAQTYVPPENLRVIGWPVKTHSDDGKAEARLEIRRRHGIPPDCNLVLFCGRIHAVKRPFETVSAFLDASLPNSVIMMIGPANSEDEGRLRAIAAGSDHRCIYAGAVFGPALHTYYRAADSFVSFSRKENFGYTIMEAVGFALPVLVSSQLDISPEIADSRSGFVVGDVSNQGMVSAFQSFACLGAEERLAMAARGREWVASQFSCEKFTADVGKLLGEVLPGVERSSASEFKYG